MTTASNACVPSSLSDYKIDAGSVDPRCAARRARHRFARRGRTVVQRRGRIRASPAARAGAAADGRRRRRLHRRLIVTQNATQRDQCGRDRLAHWDEPVRMRRVAVTRHGHRLAARATTARRSCDLRCAGRSAIRRSRRAVRRERLAAPLAAPAHFDGADHFAPPKPAHARSRQPVRAGPRRVRRSPMRASSDEARPRPRRRLPRHRHGRQRRPRDDGYQIAVRAKVPIASSHSAVLMGMHNAPAAWIGIEQGCAGPTSPIPRRVRRRRSRSARPARIAAASST